ncbi:MAG: PilN domain-containing protein [Nitrospirales bacterium]|nr:PilN domain-containing protein [Nitrospira sp.]MDR4502469.1 PilN domain-containing protein [Nitrospirales bacterium]
MKPRTHLSLAAPGMKNLSLTQWVLTLVTVGTLIISGCIWWASQTIDEESAQFRQLTNELRAHNQELIMKASSRGFDLSKARIESLPKEIQFANQVRKQLGFSWTQFLNDLESTVPTTIAMDSVKVNFKEASIALSGSAKTLADINGLVDHLESHPSFHHVVLSQHAQKRQKKSPESPFVLFTLTVLYEPTQNTTVNS